MIRRQTLQARRLQPVSVIAVLAVAAFLIAGPLAAGECGNPCTVTGTSFPNLQLVDSTSAAEDWAIRTVSNGAELQIFNVTFTERPLKIEAGAGSSDNLLYLDADERVGIGTTIPVANLQISGTFPEIRLDDTSAGSGSVDLLMIFDTFAIQGNDGITSIVSIDTRSPINALGIDDNGRVGINGTPEAQLHVGGDARVDGDIAIGSSRTIKTAFEPVSPAEILATVANLPLTSWRYQSEGEIDRHIGPFAEDFQRLFGLGDGKTISVIDAQGVAFAAIQGLVESNAVLHQELADRSAEVKQLESRLGAIEVLLTSEPRGEDQ